MSMPWLMLSWTPNFTSASLKMKFFHAQKSSHLRRSWMVRLFRTQSMASSVIDLTLSRQKAWRGLCSGMKISMASWSCPTWFQRIARQSYWLDIRRDECALWVAYGFTSAFSLIWSFHLTSLNQVARERFETRSLLLKVAKSLRIAQMSYITVSGAWCWLA